jgi:hypothetical protein
VNSQKKVAKAAIAKSRTSHPAIYVRLGSRDFWHGTYAKASIRVKAGEYQYLTWRDGDQVRTFYLGKKRHYCPTAAAAIAPGLAPSRSSSSRSSVGQESWAAARTKRAKQKKEKP